MLAPFGDPAPFVEFAQELAADPRLRDRVREAAHERARELPWDRVLDDLEVVLYDVAARSRATRNATCARPATGPRTDHAPL